MQMLEASVLINAGSLLNAGGSEARVDRSFMVCCLEIKTGVLSHKRYSMLFMNETVVA